MKKKGLPVLIVLILIFLIGAAGMGVHLIKKYTPTEDRMDANTYYSITDSSELPLIMGTEILETRGKMIDGEAYLSQDIVNQYLNKRFYWDSNENLMLYTTPTEKYIIKPGSNSYTVGDDENKEDYVICEEADESLYINVKFVQKFTDMDYELFEEPNRLVVQYQWNEVPTVEVTEDDAAVRYQGGIKSEILTNVSKGTLLRVIEELEEWDHVATSDGFVGYIKKDDVAGTAAPTSFPRDFEEPEYTSVSRDFKINMAWHQVTSEAANETFDDAIKGAKGVNVISPTWFSIKDNKGNITNFATEGYVTKAHKKGLEVWGLVDNFSPDINTLEVLSNTTTRTALANNIVKQALRFSLDGINIDFETLAEETGPHFIQFLRELSIICRENKLILSVDNPMPEEYNMHYDFEAQGEVVDYVVLMGYDEHYMGSEEAGSVASLPWVEAGIQKILEYVPAEKVVNGVPFYTRIWKTSAGVVTSEAVGMDEADAFVNEHKIETYWNTEVSQNCGEYEDGNDLYQVWLEDEESIAAKMELIKKYELAGVAEWKLGLERTSIWKVIQSGLK